MKYRAWFLCLVVIVAFTGCTPALLTPAERRKADLDYWTMAGEKFMNVEEDLASSESSYDQHEYSWASRYVDTGLGVASEAHDVATQAPWGDVAQRLTAAADAITHTLNDFKAGVQNNDASAMTKAYDDYLTYARNAIAATKDARVDYTHEGGKGNDILDFYSQGNGGESNAPAFQHYIHELRAKAPR